jgi:hypothetical protein
MFRSTAGLSPTAPGGSSDTPGRDRPERYLFGVAFRAGLAGDLDVAAPESNPDQARPDISTSQYANVIVRRGGGLKYSWHFRKVFFQAFTGRTLEPGETYVCRLDPDALELEPGRYEVIAYLTTYRLRVFRRHSLLVNG